MEIPMKYPLYSEEKLHTLVYAKGERVSVVMFSWRQTIFKHRLTQIRRTVPKTYRGKG